MSGKLFIDDVGDAPGDDWDVARTSEQAVDMMCTGGYSLVSLDYVLAHGDTGETVVAWWAANGHWPAEIRLHSSSHDGRKLLAALIHDATHGRVDVAVSS